MTCETIRDHAAAYALGALKPEERAAVEAHARACPACARELAELEQVTARLALSLPQHEPPPAVLERVVAAARADGGTEGQGDRDTGRQSEQIPPSPRPSVPSSRQPRWLSLGALAAALAALVWGATLQVQLGATQRQLAETNGQLERLRGAYSTVVEVLASPTTRERDLLPREGAPAARGKVWVDPASGRGMMMARDLPPLPEGHTYQVWLSSPQGRQSAGFLRPYDDGVYYIVLQAPDKLTDFNSLGVTREPLGGSPAPTGPRIIGGEL
jgi:anti-sigma-K factor RskA